MSHHAHYPSLDAFETNRPTTQSGTPSMEVTKAAKQAVVGLIESGIVGDKGKEDFVIEISGHENEGHKKAAGYTNDTIRVSITQK